MKKLSGVLLLAFLWSCNGESSKNGVPVLNISNQAAGIAVSIDNASGKNGQLWVNDKPVAAFNAAGANEISDQYLHPGMNYLRFVSGADSLSDSVFFSYQIGYQLVKEYPHDTANFTEGLFLDNNVLYESTGLEGKSRVARYQVGPQGFTLINDVKNDASIFGEGIATSGNDLYQLTWKNNYVLVYDKTTLARKSQFVYPNEGWGLTPNGDSLIASDGSATLFFISPAKFEIYNRLAVIGDSGPLKNINELELVRNYVVANVWQTNTLVFIDKKTGIVAATADLTALANSAANENPNRDVLNGIAYDPADGSFLVTGKLWTKIYRIKLDAVWDKLAGQAL